MFVPLILSIVYRGNLFVPPDLLP